MGIHLDPGNVGYAAARRSDIFVDQSGLIRFTNQRIGTAGKRICVTRPRRFGKSTALDMLAAYYSLGADSKTLFQDLQIGQDPSFLQHLNRHHVIRIDVNACLCGARNVGRGEQVLAFLECEVVQDLVRAFPDCALSEEDSIASALWKCFRQDPDNRFLFLVDEWDVLFRDPQVSQQVQQDYLAFLVGLFQTADLDPCIDLVYLTGILPVIRDLPGLEHALDNMEEYTMTQPGPLAEYVGFPEDTVQALCRQWDMPMEAIREQYEGYPLKGAGTIYCPLCISRALRHGVIRSDWTETSSYQVIVDLLETGIPGLRDAVRDLLAERPVRIDAAGSSNNPRILRRREDVLTLLVHYGYLSYEEDSGTVRVPNREAEGEFRNAWKAIGAGKGTENRRKVRR